jgi:hypothetical protein
MSDPIPDIEDVETAPTIDVFTKDEAPEFEKPKYMVVGDKFVAQSEQGELWFPMSFKTKAFRLMPEDLELIGQVFYLCADDQKLLEKLDELDIEDSREIARKFFTAYRERQRARLGESGRSSRS